jgi:TolB protein
MSRRTSFLIVGGAIGCGLILLCLFLAAVGGYTYLNSTNAGQVNRIAYVDNNQDIQVIDARGTHRVALTTDAAGTSSRAYLFPTWSPDSQRVAFVGVNITDTTRVTTLYAAPATGGKPTVIFTSATETPFYFYWSPDSQWIAFLAGSNDGQSLMLSRADGQSPARKLESGSPFYWAWSPDSRALLMHIGGSIRDSSDAEIAVLPRDSAGAPQTLKASPASFQAPHYSPDGSMMLFAATTNSADDALFLADARGNNARAIANYQGGIAFAWSPDGQKIASLVTPDDASLPYFGPLWVSAADGADRQKLIDDNALAFFWSPDSRQIAYLTIVAPNDNNTSSNVNPRARNVPSPQAQDVRLRWQVIDVASKRTRTLATFVPTGDLLQILPYFDQYARSLTFWSPDSQSFVYTQNENNDTGSVWVTDVAGSAAPRRVGDGTLAVWSWK